MMVLVMLLLIEGMVAGMLALANHTRATAAAQLRNARADAAARAAVQRVLKQWESSTLDTLRVGALSTPPVGAGAEADASWSTTVERLPTQFLIHAEARVGSAGTFSRSRVVAVARTLDRAAVLAELDAALKSEGQIVIAGAATMTAQDTSCTAAPPTGAALVTAVPPIMAQSVVVTGAIVVDSTLPWRDSLALGNAMWSDIAAIADRTESGAITPAPIVTAGTCNAAASANWGDPMLPASPCAGYFPLIYAAGDLTMIGGRGQGLLVVAGVLTMTGNAQFAGAIVARDGLSVGPAARLRGAALSRAGYALVDDAEMVFSPCMLAKVVTQTPAAHRLMPQWRRFLPVF
jgi:hypothetical protein